MSNTNNNSSFYKKEFSKIFFEVFDYTEEIKKRDYLIKFLGFFNRQMTFNPTKGNFDKLCQVFLSISEHTGLSVNKYYESINILKRSTLMSMIIERYDLLNFHTFSKLWDSELSSRIAPDNRDGTPVEITKADYRITFSFEMLWLKYLEIKMRDIVRCMFFDGIESVPTHEVEAILSGDNKVKFEITDAFMHYVHSNFQLYDYYKEEAYLDMPDNFLHNKNYEEIYHQKTMQVSFLKQRIKYYKEREELYLRKPKIIIHNHPLLDEWKKAICKSFIKKPFDSVDEID